MGAGLSKEQAKMYLFLLENGLAPVKVIASKTGIGRALAYKVLEQLIKLELAEKREDIGKVALFFPAHPKRIKELVGVRKERALEAGEALERSFGLLASSFNLLSGKPNIQFFEGIEGIQRVYDDILETNQHIRVISSPIHHGKQEALHLIREQIEKQAAQKIQTKAITPHAEGQTETTTLVSDDAKYLITRKIVPVEKLNIPAQVIVYGDKVAITNFRETIVTAVIESKYIAETFRLIFEYIWEKS